MRTVVFFKGCPLRCRWCHSPETQSQEPEVLVSSDRCIRCGACVTACEAGAARLGPAGPRTNRVLCHGCVSCAVCCPTGARVVVGEWMDAETVMDVVRRDVPFYDASGGGATFSGGEPLLQVDLLEALLERCRTERIHAAVETCGHVDPQAVRRVSRYSPLFLFDLKLAGADQHRRTTGASNSTILRNLRDLAMSGADIVVRYPLIPGINDSAGEVLAVGRLAASVGVRRIDVLPYHRAGLAKYDRLDRPYTLGDIPEASAEGSAAAAEHLRRCGLDVRVGGSS